MKQANITAKKAYRIAYDDGKKAGIKEAGFWLEKSISPDEIWAWESCIEDLKQGKIPS